MTEEPNIALVEAITEVADALVTGAERDRRGLIVANVADGLFAIARSIELVAGSIDRLGTADAATPMGAIEALIVGLRENSERTAEAIESVAASIDLACIDFKLKDTNND